MFTRNRSSGKNKIKLRFESRERLFLLMETEYENNETRNFVMKLVRINFVPLWIRIKDKIKLAILKVMKFCIFCGGIVWTCD